MSRNKQIVTDHALVRYIERVLGVNLQEVRRAILTDSIKAAVKGGAASVTIDGFTYIIENGRITTIIKGRQRNKKKRNGEKG